MLKQVFIFLLVMLLATGSFLGWKLFGPSVQEPEGKFFYIRTGESFSEMTDNLVREKIISHRFWFLQAARILKFTMPKAGKFSIRKDMSIYQLIRILKNGKQTPVNLVITKLRLKEELARKLGNQFEFDSAKAMQFLGSNDSLSVYGADTNTVLAFILPDTYTYFWNSTPKKVWEKLFQHWKKFWTEERKAKATQWGLTPVQVMTLASIIDEESNYLPEKTTIASVYLNRIQKKMPLQADPTIKYAVKDFSLKRIYQKHLALESPFNTYKNTGLPPGPICTPQAATVDAVLNAPKTDFLYFVAKSDFSGVHVFSSNYNDHLKKAREYQQALSQLEASRKANQ